MSMMFEPLKKYAQFEGRSRRSEYWMFALFLWLVEIAFWILISAMGGFYDPMTGHLGGGAMLAFPLFGIFGLAVLIPSVAVSIRRLHDTDRSGWWLLIGLIPLIGGVVLFIFMLLDGTPGANRYGSDLKGRTTLAPAAAEFPTTA